jgi:DNA-binding Xre family transcriptional regulator
MKYRIKELAEARGLNKSQLARRCDVHGETISKIWADSNVDVISDTSTATLEKIAKVLGVTVNDLIVPEL